MLYLSRIICTSVLAANLFASPIASAENTRGIKFEANGLELFGWIPYATDKIVSIPPIKLPNGELPMDFPATLINFPGNDKTQHFTISIAADPKIDHSKLHLIARDEKQQTVLDFTYSVVSTSSATNQVITFICTAKCDPKLIKQLIIAKQLAVSPLQNQL